MQTRQRDQLSNDGSTNRPYLMHETPVCGTLLRRRPDLPSACSAMQRGQIMIGGDMTPASLIGGENVQHSGKRQHLHANTVVPRKSSPILPDDTPLENRSTPTGVLLLLVPIKQAYVRSATMRFAH